MEITEREPRETRLTVHPIKQVLFTIMIAIAGGCGGDASSSSVDAAPAVDASPDAAITPFNLTGTVNEPAASGSGSAIEGALVCIHPLAHPSCTSSDSTGDFSIDVTPPTTPTDVTEVTTANGHLGAVFLSGWTLTEANYSSSIVLSSDAAATEFLQTQAGFTYPVTNTGFIEIFVGTGTRGVAAVGATATISPASGSGPVYLDATGTPAPTLTAVSSSGNVLWGNLAPGTYEITVTAAGKTCTVFTGGHTPPATAGYWAPTGGTTLGVGVVGGALTSGSAVICK